MGENIGEARLPNYECMFTARSGTFGLTMCNSDQLPSRRSIACSAERVAHQGQRLGAISGPMSRLGVDSSNPLLV